jgi:serine/threonine protein kinase
MVEASFVHCSLQITRNGVGYGLNKNQFTSEAHWFVPKKEAFSFTLGSDVTTIQIKGLAPQHLSCSLLDNTLAIEKVSDKVQLTSADGTQHTVAPGQKYSIPVLAKGPAAPPWKITFPNRTVVTGRVWEERQFLPPDVISYLEKRHGPIQKIDEGQSSLIFRTKDDKVLKVLSPRFMSSKGVVARYINAARKFQTLPSPPFFSLQEIVYRHTPLVCYVLMDYFPSESLETYLAKKGIIPLTEAQNIVRGVAEKLKIFQSLGYAYRNLSPDNILVGKNGEIRTTGFFLLKTEVNVTAAGAQMVVVNYTSPEQIEDPATTDVFTDIFSLGAIFHAMVIGEPPFGATKQIEYVAMLMNPSSQLASSEIQKAAPFLAAKICEQIAAMLARDKKKRPDPDTLLKWFTPAPKVQPVKPAPQPAALATDELAGDLLDNLDRVKEARPSPMIVPSADKECPDESSTFNNLLQQIDKIDIHLEEDVPTDLGRRLQDQQQELTENFKLSELRITKMYPMMSRADIIKSETPASPAASPSPKSGRSQRITKGFSEQAVPEPNVAPATRETMESLAQKALEVQDAKKNAEGKSKPKTQKLASHPLKSAARQAEATKTHWRQLALLGIFCLLGVFFFAPWGKAKTAPSPTGNTPQPETIPAPPTVPSDTVNHEGKPQQSGQNQSQPVKPAVVSMQGRIVRVYRYENAIQYFVFVATERAGEYAVTVPDGWPEHIIDAAQKNNEPVDITGTQETLGSGVLVLTGNRQTRDYIALKKIKCEAGVFPRE